jgi:hypothetical protein
MERSKKILGDGERIVPVRPRRDRIGVGVPVILVPRQLAARIEPRPQVPEHFVEKKKALAVRIFARAGPAQIKRVGIPEHAGGEGLVALRLGDHPVERAIGIVPVEIL